MVSIDAVKGGYRVVVDIQLAGELEFVNVIADAIQQLRCELVTEYSKNGAAARLAELQSLATTPLKALPPRIN